MDKLALEKEIQVLKDKNHKLSGALISLTLSVSVHPDCTEGSEFDDFSNSALEALNFNEDGN